MRSEAKPWTKAELLAFGIPPQLWDIAHWWGSLAEMQEDMPGWANSDVGNSEGNSQVWNSKRPMKQGTS